MAPSTAKSYTIFILGGSWERCPRPHASHLRAYSVTVLSALLPCDTPACPAGGPLRILSSSFGSGPSCRPSASSLSIRFRKAVRSALYNEPVDEGESEFSYFSILLSRSASSSLRRSFSISRSIILLARPASSSAIFFCEFLYSVVTFTSSLRRSDTSDGLTKARESRDQ